MHRIANIYRGAGKFALSEPGDEVETSCNNTSFDFTGFDSSNGFMYFDIQADNWSDLSTLRFAISSVSSCDANSGYYYKSIAGSELSIYDVTFDNGWKTFRIPLNNMSLTGPSFDIAESYHFQIKLTYVNTADQYLGITNWYLEYGSEVNSLMQFSIVASGGGDAIGFEPEWDYSYDMTKLENVHRLENGDFYVYKTGDYSKIDFKVQYFPMSSANVVNSLWLNNVPLWYFTANSYSATIDDVMLRDKKRPFQEYQEYYTDLMTGNIKLESI